ncbi:protein SERAC1 [Trichoderma asperellum]|uniref:Protein SERAC1 n=1 Tax=Trichoderma asperellum TaxID=101201 RepID=A0A6V8QSQ2_TRIAP|nr:protein SERAC1 [Trichoderma asperellum]
MARGGGGGPIRRASGSLALDLPAPPPARRRSGRTKTPSIFTDTDDTDLKPRVSERFSEKPGTGTGDSHNQQPRTRFTIDPEGELTHDETSVDVVTVPCPGGHPLRSWNRDGLMGRYFGAPSMRDAEVNEVERQGPSWVRQGIRREANRARILLYEHPEVVDGMTLNKLAIALLDELKELRTREKQQERPLLFIGHSIGGLVVKMALVRASRDAKYEGILRECYGVAFFGTPHQGSSYFAMPTLASSIQHLLQLSAPLPASLTDDLRMGNHLLLHVDEDFKIVSDDLRVWTFYETIDSRLSANSGDIYFTAPLTSIKSAILGMRQERIFPLQGDHANIASFGRHNVHTLRLFLRQLAEHIEKADSNAREDARAGKWMLNLEQKVTVEVHGFFDDAGIDDGTVRAWSTRLPLREFLNKGPEACLSERLNESEGPPEEGRFLAMRGRTGLVDMDGPPEAVSFPPDPLTVKNALGINQDMMIPSVDHTAKEEYGICTVSNAFTFHGWAIDTPFSTYLASSSANVTFSETLAPYAALVGDENDSDDDGDEGGLEGSPKLPESVLAIRKMAKERGHRPSETVIVDDGVLVHTAFIKPEAKARKFVWIHLPFNNPTWVTAVLQTLQVSYQRDFSALSNHDFWVRRHTRGRHSQHYAHFAKPGCYFTAPRTLSPRAHSVTSRSLSPPGEDDQMYVCLFLPYLHFDSYKRLIRRRELIAKRLAHGRARPVPESVAKSDSLELQVVWEFLGHDPPINCRRTLDQYGYPSIRDTRSRDDDQMLYKLTKERYYDVAEYRGLYNQTSGSGSASGESSNKSGNGSGTGSGNVGGSRTGSWREKLNKQNGGENGDEEAEKDVLNGNVLMVDQLWIWTISTHTLLSFFPKRESDPIEGPLYQQADLRDSIFNDVNVDLTRLCDTSFDLAALAALHAVSVLLDRSSHPDLEVFRIFEEAISVLTEKLTTSLKEFRSEGFRDKAFDYEPVENKARSIRERHKQEGRRAEQENRDNTSALLELRDIEDELATLLGLFERQTKVISSMHTIYNRPEMRAHTVHGRGFLVEALKRLGEYIHVTEEMIRRVKNTRDEYDKLLQMVQRQAQVDEVRLSRLHADLASAQSRSVLIFTTFTVIFLPLQFFTGIFGMNTQEWAGGDNLPLRTIAVIGIPASVALIVVTLIVAWSTNARRFFKWIGRQYGGALRFFYEIFGKPVAQWTMKYMDDVAARRGGKRRQGGPGRSEDRAPNGSLSTETSDFWERHRLERERGYQIPEVNKAPASRAKGGAKLRKSQRG